MRKLRREIDDGFTHGLPEQSNAVHVGLVSAQAEHLPVFHGLRLKSSLGMSVWVLPILNWYEERTMMTAAQKK